MSQHLAEQGDPGCPVRRKVQTSKQGLQPGLRVLQRIIIAGHEQSHIDTTSVRAVGGRRCSVEMIHGYYSISVDPSASHTRYLEHLGWKAPAALPGHASSKVQKKACGAFFHVASSVNLCSPRQVNSVYMRTACVSVSHHMAIWCPCVDD